MTRSLSAGLLNVSGVSVYGETVGLSPRFVRTMLDRLLKTQVEELLRTGDVHEIRRTLSLCEPSEVGAILEDLPGPDAVVLSGTLL